MSVASHASTNEQTAPPALKEIFDVARIHHFADALHAIYPAFQREAFLAQTLSGLDGLSLMQRLRRVTECIHAQMPPDYRQTLAILRDFAPHINHSFASMVLPDYVGLYGRHDFDVSMDAFKFFTTFGSSEFAVREFLRLDLPRALATMEAWSRDENEHVRRLASEGSRPRLPWSFRLDALVRDPSPTAPILDNLKQDSSLYVRKSVANHLNDITKDHPDWVMDRLTQWPLDHTYTAWIAKRALRTLIKQGNSRALALIGAGERAQVELQAFTVEPQSITLGETVTLHVQLKSTATTAQRLVVDYTIHYVKKSGGSSPKVFKFKEFTLGAGESITLTRKQSIRNFTTRIHYPGRHEVEIMVNGEQMAQGYFELTM